MINQLIKLISGVVILYLLYILAAIIYGLLTDWKPEAKLKMAPAVVSDQTVIRDSLLRLGIWNLGYAGLGKESDFFFESGMLLSGKHEVYPSKEIVDKNWEGIKAFVGATPADIWLLQEVDSASRRSWFIDQVTSIGETLGGKSVVFFPNYKNGRVPLPILEPWKVYGKIYSGLATYAHFQPEEMTRYQLPGSYGPIVRIFQLDRCVGLTRFATAGGKQLVVLNVHNSAYDKGGKLKKQQMEFMKELMEREYKAGNYVIAGGDWNQCPPNFRFDGFIPGKGEGYEQINIPQDFMPADWTWVYDTRIPTNRKVTDPYVPGETFITLIDFFLVSPNVRVLSVNGRDLQFEFSDHQPVLMEVELL